MTEQVHRAQLTRPEDITTFVLAGNATLTLVSKKTGTRYTYKVTKLKGEPGTPELWFVKVMYGPDNESDYAFFGTIFPTGFKVSKKTNLQPSDPRVKVWQWFWERVSTGRMPENLEVWHEGKCCRCGRTLTVPESIARGIGPECVKFVGQHQLRLFPVAA